MENIPGLRQISGDQARAEILEYFQNHAGTKLYVLDISRELKLDIGLVTGIAGQLLTEGIIQLAETGSN